MKKKFFVSAFLALSVFALIEFITSCSSGFEEEVIDISVSNQRLKVEELAEEYGLNVILDEAFATRASEISLSEIEEEFKIISSLKGQYEIVNIGEEDSIVLVAFNKNFLNPKGVPSNQENVTGSYTFNSLKRVTFLVGNQTDYYIFYISITIEWDFTTHNDITISPTVELHSNIINSSINPESLTIQVLGANPGTIHFAFLLNVQSDNYTYNFSVTGEYAISTGIGQIFIS